MAVYDLPGSVGAVDDSNMTGTVDIPGISVGAFTHATTFIVAWAINANVVVHPGAVSA